MCRYCDPEIMAELPETHNAQIEFSGRIFDTCIDTDKGLPYIMLPGDYDIPIKYCPFCGRKMK